MLSKRSCPPCDCTKRFLRSAKHCCTFESSDFFQPAFLRFPVPKIRLQLLSGIAFSPAWTHLFLKKTPSRRNILRFNHHDSESFEWHKGSMAASLGNPQSRFPAMTIPEPRPDLKLGVE